MQTVAEPFITDDIEAWAIDRSKVLVTCRDLLRGLQAEKGYGSLGWNRTNDQRINSPTLYR